MALKQFLASLSKKESTDVSTQDQAAQTALASDAFPIIVTPELNMELYQKIPLAQCAALGGMLGQLPSAARTLTTTVTKKVALKETLFTACCPKGVKGFLWMGPNGIDGNIMQQLPNKQYQIVHRLRFQPVDKLDITRTTTTTMPVNPGTIFIAATLLMVVQKVEALQKTADEILGFLTLEKQARQRGNLNMLADMFEEYKQSFTKEALWTQKLGTVQAIERESQQDMIFYATQVEKELKDPARWHREAASNELLRDIKADFAEYQLACYLYGFSQFMEVMLQKMFEEEHLQFIIQKMQANAARYKELYQNCRTHLANYQRSSLESKVKGTLAGVAKGAGNWIASKPVLSRGPVDEMLLNASSALEQSKRNTLTETIAALEPLAEDRLSTFTNYLKRLNLLYNNPEGVMTDGENLYLLKAAQ